MNVDTLQIHLNSKNADGYNNGSFSDCNFYLPIIELPLQHTIMLSVQSAVIPYTFYNIDDTNNTLIWVLSDNHGGHLTIPKGNYNAINLASLLAVLMSDPGLNSIFTVKYNPITNKFTFTNSSLNYIFEKQSTCFTILGIATSTWTTNKIYTSESCVNLLSKTCLCIQSNLPTSNINHKNLSEGNILVSFPVNVPPYSLITYSNNSSFKTNLFSNTINFINIRIIDQDNNLVDLNGCFFSLTLQIDVFDFVN